MSENPRFASKAEAERFLARIERQCEQRMAYYEGIGEKRAARVWEHAALSIFKNRNPEPFMALGTMKRLPVTIEEFISSREFLADTFTIWPTLMPDLKAMNPDVFIGEEPVHEALLGGATGTGKTFLSQATIIYQCYLFSCFNNPRRLFKLSPVTPVVFMLQSVSPTITKRVIYDPLRVAMINMPYVKKYMPYDKYKESSLEFEDGLMIVPSAASLQSIVGQAIPGAILDEVNFMAVVENSKQVPGQNGLGGKFDQAEIAYTNLSRRRRRSFLTKGYSMGCLCVVSSTRYVGDFLDRRIDEVRKFGEKNILTLRRKQYEVAPQERYSGEKFRVLIGRTEYPTRVLEDYEQEGVHYPEGAHVELVPVELRTDFLRNPEGAQRDYIGIASSAITPFFRKRQKINDALARGDERGIPAFVTRDSVILAEHGMPEFNVSVLRSLSKTERAKPRWIHVDLSRAVDRCGIGMVALDGFITSPVQNVRGVASTLPKFTVEIAVGIKPSSYAEIDIATVRNWILQLVAIYGLNVVAVSFDGFDSRETIQSLQKSGIRASVVSMDTSTAPYDDLRDAIYEDRVDIQPDCELLAHELRTLEFFADKNRVDHPPRGTKDVADAVAGAIHNAIKSRRVRNGVMLTEDSDYVPEYQEHEEDGPADGRLADQPASRPRPSPSLTSAAERIQAIKNSATPRFRLRDPVVRIRKP
jgi:hypothetical protein